MEINCWLEKSKVCFICGICVRITAWESEQVLAFPQKTGSELVQLDTWWTEPQLHPSSKALSTFWKEREKYKAKCLHFNQQKLQLTGLCPLTEISPPGKLKKGSYWVEAADERRTAALSACLVYNRLFLLMSEIPCKSGQWQDLVAKLKCFLLIIELHCMEHPFPLADTSDGVKKGPSSV